MSAWTAWAETFLHALAFFALLAVWIFLGVVAWRHERGRE